MNMLKGKKGLIMGVANERSIAWAIAKAAKEHGAELAFSYQGEILEKRVRPLAESIDCNTLITCDVRDDQSLEDLFKALKEKWGKIDFIVHSLAFADRETLKGRYFDTKREHFNEALEISAYSLAAVARHAEHVLNDNGSIITMTYFGAERVIPNYNVMGIAKAALEASIKYLAVDYGSRGIRVNGISAGAIKTLAASAIGDFKSFLAFCEHNSPLKQNVDQEDVANAALYLLSDLSKRVTGEVLHVDSGYHIMGMGTPPEGE